MNNQLQISSTGSAKTSQLLYNLNTVKPGGKQEVIASGTASVPTMTASAGGERKCPHYSSISKIHI